MKYKYLEKKINYDGSQLKSLFGYLENGILGDSIIAFEGACDVSFDHMVDGEDLLQNAAIRSNGMIHFIIEEFGQSLELAVTRQRLFASIALEELTKLAPKSDWSRSGDDLYVLGGKLSISIATVSPVSSLIHFAMNITNENTPVKTASLQDLGLKPKDVADRIAHRYLEEIQTIKQACCKVRWVR